METRLERISPIWYSRRMGALRFGWYQCGVMLVANRPGGYGLLGIVLMVPRVDVILSLNVDR